MNENEIFLRETRFCVYSIKFFPNQEAVNYDLIMQQFFWPFMCHVISSWHYFVRSQQRKSFEIFSKLTTNIPDRRQFFRHSLNMKRFNTYLWCFHFCI